MTSSLKRSNVERMAYFSLAHREAVGHLKGHVVPRRFLQPVAGACKGGSINHRLSIIGRAFITVGHDSLEKQTPFPQGPVFVI